MRKPSLADAATEAAHFSYFVTVAGEPKRCSLASRFFLGAEVPWSWRLEPKLIGTKRNRKTCSGHDIIRSEAITETCLSPLSE